MKNKFFLLSTLCLALIPLSACTKAAASSSSSVTPPASSSTSSSSSSVAPSSSSVAPSSSSSEAPSSSSSETPSSSSVAPSSSSSSSSSEPVEDTVKELKTSDTSVLVADASDANVYSDGFFTGSGMSIATNDCWKTNGTSDIAATTTAKAHFVKFTTGGAGSIYIEAKGGTTGDDSRRIYVALADAEGKISTYLGRIVMDLNPDTGKAVKCNGTITLPKAGTYYILSNAGCSIYDIKVTYNTGVASKTADVITETIADDNIFDPTELMPTPGAIGADKTVGNYKISGVTAELDYNSTRTLDKNNNIYRCNHLKMASADTLTLTASGAGTLTVYAQSSDSDVTDIKLDVYNAEGTSLGSPVSIVSATTSKNPTLASFAIPSSGAYTIKSNSTTSTLIYLAKFAAV